MGLWTKVKAWFLDVDEHAVNDPQHAAFKEVKDDPFTDDQLQQAIYQGELEVWPAELIKTPEEYEAEEWDAERTAPKTKAEADAEARETGGFIL